jgi:hypothetical protein
MVEATRRLAVELRLLVQEGERGEANALIEVGHETRRAYATADSLAPGC